MTKGIGDTDGTKPNWAKRAADSNTIRIMDQVRDLYATVQKVLIDRDCLKRAERAQDQEIERILGQLQIAHETVYAMASEGALAHRHLDQIRRLLDNAQG